MQFFAPRRRFFRKMLSGKEPILTLLSKKVWKTWIMKKKFTEMRIFTKNAFFGHQMALFQEKLRNFGDFWMIFWQILKFLTKILHFLGKNLDFDWLSSKILTDICFEIKRDNFHAWSTWFVQRLPPDGVFFENFKWTKANFDTSFKKKFERHGFWRKSYRNENLAIDLLLTFWKFKETAEKREISHRKARKRQVLSLTKEKMGKKVIQLTEKQENWIYWSLETLINSSKLKYRRNLCWEPLKLTKMDRFWTDFKPFWQKFKKMKPWNLEFFTPNDSDKSKMGSKFGTLQKNFSNFPRSPENWGLIWTILAEL